MHEMSDRDSLEFLIGSRVVNVAFGRYQIDIEFDPKCFLTAEYLIEYATLDDGRESLDIQKALPGCTTLPTNW